ncbi:TIR domain-containing protein [Xanthomarina spongicola]|uniref:Putative nucleotide-binding protein n=1 Tax=Xanthomarina spongicola TaxID=570520 RepID=A0A316DD32_9FLAO|nr:nucleotide-binding protein [Xanthomarina spongicola]PWK16121.1 putative nucleotide-binding protein [Xanthomarina spongicola]
MNKTELLQSLEKESKDLTYKDGNLGKVKKRAEMLVTKIFGGKSEYIPALRKIRFSPAMAWSGMDKSYYEKSFISGKNELINLINVMQEDLNLSDSFEIIENGETQVIKESFNKIFLVHGHNEEMKQSSARFIEKLSLKPIILHEQPNRGRTIIEKFTDYSNVDFAIVLLSADDLAFSKKDKVENASFRARQNVILELGFFLGKLGRERVVVLFEQVDNFEIPSDYQGVIFIPYDSNGNWKLPIAKELKAVGFKIDGSKLLE